MDILFGSVPFIAVLRYLERKVEILVSAASGPIGALRVREAEGLRRRGRPRIENSCRFHGILNGMDIMGRDPRGEPRRLPENTTRERYLSGTVALNIAADEPTGDWHVEMAFFRPRRTTPRCFVVGRDCEVDTTPLLGTRGVADRSDVLRRMGVPNVPKRLYAADHARAIADLVLDAVLCDQSPAFAILDDWMPRPQDKCRVVELLRVALDRLNESQQAAVVAWLSANRDS